MKNGNCPSGVSAASVSHSTCTGPAKLSRLTPCWRAFVFNRWLLTREGDWKFVTKNSIDFCGPADAPGSKGEYRKAMIHAGLICLNGPVGMDLDMQIKLFETALDEPDQNSDLINQVLEITLDDANDAEFTIIRYELPTLPFPFPEGAARRTPGSPVRAARAVTR
jgi:hypothetical protein